MPPLVPPPANASSSRLPCVLAMPAYNEEECISYVISGWRDEFERLFGQNFRLVVVNDGSRDRTGALLDAAAAAEPRLIVVHQKNAGHGGALLHAYRKAVALQPDYVFHVDSDDQFKPSDFERLWKARNASPCILGYRSVRHDALHRLVITRILRLVLFCLYGRYLKDSNVPFRLLKTSFLSEALAIIPPDTFAPNIFIAVLGARIDAKLMHIPVSHEDRKTGTVSIVRWKLIRVCFRCVGELLRFRGNLNRNAARVRTAVFQTA